MVSKQIEEEIGSAIESMLLLLQDEEKNTTKSKQTSLENINQINEVQEVNIVNSKEKINAARIEISKEIKSEIVNSEKHTESNEINKKIGSNSNVNLSDVYGKSKIELPMEITKNGKHNIPNQNNTIKSKKNNKNARNNTSESPKKEKPGGNIERNSLKKDPSCSGVGVVVTKFGRVVRPRFVYEKTPNKLKLAQPEPKKKDSSIKSKASFQSDSLENTKTIKTPKVKSNNLILSSKNTISKKRKSTGEESTSCQNKKRIQKNLFE